MPRLPLVLIAAIAAISIGGVQLAQSQTEPPAAQAAPAAKKKALTVEEKAKLKEERAAKKQAREEKKAAAAAKKAKRQECLAQGKQDNLKGMKLREFMKTCTAS
jgi:uncharacterized protein HemX